MSTIEQIVKLATDFPDWWSRGHSKRYGELTPGIFRSQWDAGRQKNKWLELNFYEKFKDSAPALIESPPANNDYINWMTLMQHHGLPTRLLDWTTSILVSAYFAVSDSHKEDGEIWIMRQTKLNEKSRIKGQPMLDNPRLKFLLREPYINNRDKLAEDLGLAAVQDSPIAFTPQMRFRRMAAQIGRFTIHPDPRVGKTIQDQLTKDELFSVRVPSSRKKILQRNLRSLGINASTIFPDLDGLSKSLIDKYRVVVRLGLMW